MDTREISSLFHHSGRKSHSISAHFSGLRPIGPVSRGIFPSQPHAGSASSKGNPKTGSRIHQSLAEGIQDPTRMRVFPGWPVSICKSRSGGVPGSVEAFCWLRRARKISARSRALPQPFRRVNWGSIGRPSGASDPLPEKATMRQTQAKVAMAALRSGSFLSDDHKSKEPVILLATSLQKRELIKWCPSSLVGPSWVISSTWLGERVLAKKAWFRVAEPSLTSF